ncbi:MAG: hypothetical protein PHX14_14150, partial [Syntrophomonadaceae bacterium]|nr:hypothetical protein [Syntrophomonadaceae bacterium]
RSIKDVSGLKLPLPINEERSRLAKNRVKNINMPMPASFRQLNADAQNEVMVVGQTGASSYLSLNPFSIGRNCGAVSTHRCNEVGDYNRSPVLLTGTRAFKAGDIFSPRYIYHSLPYRGTRSPEARQAEAREIMRYIENRVPVLNQKNSAGYESPNYLDMRSPWRIFIQDQKPEYRLKYSPAKERMERRLNQLLQELALGQLIKMQEAGSLPGSSREIQGIYRYPAQARQKKPDGVKNLVHERISKKMNTVFLRSRDQAQPSRPLKSKYSVGITGHKAPSSLYLQAGKQARSSSAHQELPDYARPVQLQTKVLQQHLSDRESLESPLKQRAQFINIETTIIHDIREFGIKTLQKQLGQESSKADRQGARRAQSAEGQSNTMLSFHQAWSKPANKYKTDPLPGMLKNKPAIFSPHEYMKMAADLSLNYKHENKQVSAVQPPVSPQQVINTIDSAVQDNSGKAALPVSRQEIKRIADQVFQELEQKIKQERQRRGFPG